MAERKRFFLVGSDRAEYEHVYGPLTSDAADPRFVLVTEDEADKIRQFPPGVPPRLGQDWEQVRKIRAAEAEAGGFDLDLEDASDVKDTSTADVHVGGDEIVAGTGTPITPNSPGANPVTDEDSGDVEATPAAKELADEKGVDLSEVDGSGAGGKITKADVEAKLED